ncbi:hypothetical protein ACJJTC_011220 [Scirpophaga incertulas]
MTSESEALKTNDFQRRRKLRIQQVREQSKDIAKKLRQRTKCEKLQHNVDLNARKEKSYLDHQDKLIKRLEQLYAQGVKSVGSSHNKAAEIIEAKLTANTVNDLSKLRGKEAALELKKKKQELLDQQKKLLERKVLAREAANIISREKSSTIAKKLQVNACGKSNEVNQDTDNLLTKPDSAIEINKNDMATQWEIEELSNASDHNVPSLVLPKDGKESAKDILENDTDKSRHLDLFALSSEMPSSLRGKVSTEEEHPTFKPSLTMVSEYLQHRALRLREADIPTNNKKQNNDLHSLKQTILHSRSSRIEGTTLACCVRDDQLIPVPSWHAESNCQFCNCNKTLLERGKYHYLSRNSEAVNNFRSIMPVHIASYTTPALRDSPFRRNNFIKNSAKEQDRSVISGTGSNITKKNCVMTYNHSTRNTKNVPYNDTNLVIKDSEMKENAYSQALRQTLNENTNEDHLKRLQEMRSKVAVTKQTVEKEYNETMTILKNLPKDKLSNNLKTSYMDDRSQNIQKDRHQQKLQQEFRKIEKEHRKDCKKEDDLGGNHTQYSWMPVPDGENNMAIHTIPTTSKDGKTTNTVKFSQANTYHEYRSKHKHTPPTKDTNKHNSKTNIETVLVQNVSDTNNSSTYSSDTSSVENLNLASNMESESSQNVSDSDKIIIYKILKSRMNKKDKDRKKRKLIDDVARVLKSLNKKECQNDMGDKNTELDQSKKGGNVVNVGEINEGIYEVVSEKRENISDLFPNKKGKDHVARLSDETVNSKPCTCENKSSSEDSVKGIQSHLGNGDISIRAQNEGCKEDCENNVTSTKSTSRQLSTSTSISSFKTAVTVEKCTGNHPHVKLVTDDRPDAGKLYIGASGFLKDDAYEVVIQLRKKDNTDVDGTASVPHSTDNIVSENLTKNNLDTQIVKKSPKIVRDILSDKASNEEEMSKPDSGIICSETLSKHVSSQDLSHLQTNDNAAEYSNNKGINDQNISTRMSDRDTTPEHCFPIPDRFTNTKSIVNPTTSTYTQTSMNSPTLKPTIYMSSSTSTTYMSPPDTVLPNYLKQYWFNTDRKNDVDTSQDGLMETIEPTTSFECCKFKELNNNGLKAIDIANQECSSVTTPNSSIVNVSHNIDHRKINRSTQISLQQLKDILKHQLISEVESKDTRNPKFCVSKTPKTKRSVHKVKSLNISRKFTKTNKPNKGYCLKSTDSDNNLSTISSRYADKKPFVCALAHDYCESLRSRKFSGDHISINNTKLRDEFGNNPLSSKSTGFIETNRSNSKNNIQCTLPCLEKEKLRDNPVDTSTQTMNHELDSEVNLVKLAEGKIQNMEKIADLTEKCTKRLSNLAKVLDEVRKNKSLAYSHISTSDTASDSEQKGEKYINKQIYHNSTQKVDELISTTPENFSGQGHLVSEYIPFLKDIPKPEEFKFATGETKSNQVITTDIQSTSKSRSKPPPALSRVNLKHGQDVVPHELSTVVEVDSPMSIKLKTQTPKSNISENVINIQNNDDSVTDLKLNKDNLKTEVNPDLLENNVTPRNNFISNSKMQMMDIKQFNEVMLKPFISLQEYAKQSDGVLDEGSNIEDLSNKENNKVNDDLSSLYSDGSLPDVISELLKRNIISEPFKFDTLSNVNSTNLSSESTISLLALSKIQNNKKKPSMTLGKKESEASDSLSISSNPDLENAFKKLGMGWASSTLKKTKECLALSSSSNTSSSSLTHFKIKTVNDLGRQELITDCISSVTQSSKRSKQREKLKDVTKSAEQQTSFINSMTVKEFLTNELAKKITFTNKSSQNETNEEMFSLLETKLPDEVKASSFLDPENTAESITSGLFSNADDLSSVKVTSNSLRNQSTSDKDDLTIPNCSLKVRKNTSDCSKSD